MPKKDKKNLILPKGLSINDLILFGIYSAGSNNQKCAFERLVKECFTSFPQAFGFSDYPQWPDSRKLDRPLRELREKKFITGDPKTSFSLTKEGNKRVLEVAKVFKQGKLL